MNRVHGIQNITSDPKMLTLSILATIGWVFEFIGQCVKQAERGGRQGIEWFNLFFFLVLLLVIVMSILNGSWQQYRLAIVVFLGVAFIQVIGELNGNILESTAGAGLKSTGLFFLSFAIIPWICIFGSEPTSVVNQFNPNVHMPANVTLPRINLPKMGNPLTTPNRNVAPPSAVAAPSPAPQQFQASPPAAASVGDMTPTTPSVKSAKALYHYEANPDDPNEIGFQKGDIIEIIDHSGKWWHARKTLPDGTVVTGIVPSNYLELIES
ncbi:Transmembrane osmosensor [Nowakowskiella sp. JEL0407]|nr:Transmembrane osmosensor [Nowakowskiella sp. JEL0407]